MPKLNRVKLFSVALIIATGVLNFDFALANPDFSQIEQELVAKKSGGRSGGGSFKRRPSSSPKRSTPRRSYKQRPSTSSPTYRRESSPTYRHSRPSNTYRSSPDSGSGGSAFLFLFLFLLIAIVILYILFKMFSQIFSGVGAGGTASKINRERDNDRVTVSMFQVALSSAAENIQQELSELSLHTDTDTESGLVMLMQESALILLRHQTAWTHVLSNSESMDINHAESAFDRLSIVERSKFSSETLSNVDGNLQIKEAKNLQEDEFADYVVVTMILGTADDHPLFTKINTETTLKEELLQLSSMRDDYLFKFELLWTPQQANKYLTDEELLLEYSNIIPLA